MKKTKKLRTRKHAVVLNRSAGGDAGITILLVILGIFMFLPMWFTPCKLSQASRRDEPYSSAFLRNKADAQELR